jgi:hypothetical protein
MSALADLFDAPIKMQRSLPAQAISWIYEPL